MGKLGFEREIDEIAGYRDVMRRLRQHVRHQHIEHVTPVKSVAVASPVEIAEHALAGEIGKPRAGSGGRWGSDRWARVKAAINCRP